MSSPSTSIAAPTDASSTSSPSLKQLKESLRLDLSSSSSTRKQNFNADLLSIIKSPNFEKIISQSLTQAVAPTTPTPTKILYPSEVTLAQRQYAQGFIDALTQVQQLNGFVPTPTLLNSPSLFTSLIPSVASSSAEQSKTISSPVLTSPTREPFSVIMQAMSGMGNLAYGFPQLTSAQLTYNATSQATTASTSTVINPPPPVKTEVLQGASDESKESSYDMYSGENDGEACSSTRSNGSPRSQDELLMSSFSSDAYDAAEQERKKLERKRARNRLAATKCRQRKLQKISELEKMVGDEKTTANRLSEELKSLQASIDQLRQVLQEHRSRGCVIPSK